MGLWKWLVGKIIKTAPNWTVSGLIEGRKYYPDEDYDALVK